MTSQAIFISDLHLNKNRPKTVDAFLSFLQNEACHTRSLFILGDLFEYWAGDDAIDDFITSILQAIYQLHSLNIPVYWIKGNRDFLTGKQFLSISGMTQLDEGYKFSFNTRQIVLAHGDSLCTDDVGYMKFRKMVRNPFWQKMFLLLPLSKRLELAQQARSDSKKEHQKMKRIDVNAQAVSNLYVSNQTNTLIHGHTHLPDDHQSQESIGSCMRYVLADWDFDSTPIRGDYLELTDDNKIIRHTF